jgi:hypothetical protein
MAQHLGRCDGDGRLSYLRVVVIGVAFEVAVAKRHEVIVGIFALGPNHQRYGGSRLIEFVLDSQLMYLFLL